MIFPTARRSGSARRRFPRPAVHLNHCGSPIERDAEAGALAGGCARRRATERSDHISDLVAYDND
jgi:hypothetical protein